MIDSTTAKTPTMVLDERLGENQRGMKNLLRDAFYPLLPALIALVVLAW